MPAGKWKIFLGVALGILTVVSGLATLTGVFRPDRPDPARVLAEAQARMRERTDRWLAQLQADSAQERRFAAAFLDVTWEAARDPRIAPALAAALADPDRAVRTRAAVALAQRGALPSQGIGALVEALAADPESVRRRAARAVLAIERDGPEDLRAALLQARNGGG